MANLTGNGAAFTSQLRQLETTDPKHPDTWNPNYQTLINNDAYLKERADQVDAARAGRPTLGDRLTQIESTQQQLDIDYQNAQTAALKYALDQAAQANWGVRALREQAQQEGEVSIANRGIVTGCTASKSTTAARNLHLAAGRCFAKGRAYDVAAGQNQASVPPNTGSGAVTVHAYLYEGAGGAWRLAVTNIGQAVPAGAVPLYSLTVPAGSTDATDPTLANVTLTDMRRIEPQWPLLLDSPASAAVQINPLSANDYHLSFDVLAATGAPCEAKSVLATSRAPNGFTVLLASAADDVRVRWRLSKLNN